MTNENVNGNASNHQYAEECSQEDDTGTFLFTSESVGEGHPGKLIADRRMSVHFPRVSYCLCTSSLTTARGNVYNLLTMALNVIQDRRIT